MTFLKATSARSRGIWSFPDGRASVPEADATWRVRHRSLVQSAQENRAGSPSLPDGLSLEERQTELGGRETKPQCLVRLRTAEGQSGERDLCGAALIGASQI